MAIIYKADLDNARKLANEILSGEEENTTKLKNAINDMINCDKNEISGPDWDILLGRSKYLIEVLEIRKNLANELNNSITSAITEMTNYIGGYTSINDADLESIADKINKANREMANIENSIRKIEDEAGTKTDLKSSINNKKACIRELSIEMNKIQNLAPTDTKIYNELNSSIEAELNRLENSVEIFEEIPFSTTL